VSATLETSPPEAPPVEVGLRGQRMPHLLGLDGLRGLAVIGVLLFHGGFTWAKGGFLGVSTFFTLSGFLITNLLVREFDTSSTIALGRFWTRRFRRLLPAALVAIGLVGLVWWRIGTPEQLHGLRADMIGALAYMANWRFYFAGTSYANLFSAPSPLQHFWSLAIEEQFYLFFPPIAWGVLKLGGRRLLAGLLATALAVSVVLELWLGNNIDRVYYGTDTRAAELLFGCLLAVWWSGRQARPTGRHGHADSGRTLTAVADVAGIVALLAMFATWALAEQTSTKLSHGGFPLYALGTTVIIYAATRPGVVARILSVPILRWAGLVSYGLYLYHWPIFLFLDKERTGLSTTPLFVVRIAVTLVVALASYFLLEQPIRRGTMIKTGRQLIVAGLAGAVVVATTAFVVTLHTPQSQIPYANQNFGDQAPTVEQASPGQTVVVDGPVATSVVYFGDSSAKDASPAISAMFQSAGTQTFLNASGAGFGLTNPKLDWRGLFADNVSKYPPNLVVMMEGFWDRDYLAANGEAAYEAVLEEAVQKATANGGKVVWIGMVTGGKYLDAPVNDVARRVAERHPDTVTYVDVQDALRIPDGATVVEAAPGSEEWPRSYRAADGTVVMLRKPDGWHFCPVGAERVAAAVNQAVSGIGWMPVAAAGWQDGAWRQSDLYNDPKGGCDVK
jgi:peptidoglycan/LPS O-acetylase OafA/YrhL